MVGVANKKATTTVVAFFWGVCREEEGNG